MKNQGIWSVKRMRYFMLCMFVGMLMVLLCPHSVNAADALKESDFTWKLNGKNIVFIDPEDGVYDSDEDEDNSISEGNMELYYDWRTQPIYKNKSNRELDSKTGKYKRVKMNIVTARGIKVGSTYKQVTKKYGNKKLVKSKSKDVVKRDIANRYLLVDTTKWKYYTDYTYQKYVIRFYYTKNKKVTSMVLVNNIEKLDSQRKDPLQVKFIAPKGKKVRTKLICGTKVYVLPKGAKISFSKNAKNTWSYGLGLISKNLKVNLGSCFYWGDATFKKNVGYDAGSFCSGVMKFDQKDYPYVSYCLDKDGKKIHYYYGDTKPTSLSDEYTYQKAPKGSIWRLIIYPNNNKKYSLKQVYYTFE